MLLIGGTVLGGVGRNLERPAASRHLTLVLGGEPRTGGNARAPLAFEPLSAELAKSAQCRVLADEATADVQRREDEFARSIAAAAKRYRHKEIADALGISRGRVAQLCVAALGVPGLTRSAGR